MKRALVTGGSGDIGAAVCRALAESGLHVIVHANSRLERARALAEALRAAGHSAEALAFDLTDEPACRAALEGLLESGPIQVLVNNAGLHDDAPLAGMPAEQWRRVVEVNLNGFYNVTQPLLLPMARTRWGRIISLSSVAAQLGNRGQSNYAAAKAGLHGASRSLALEMASRNITVNVVSPGVIAGEMTSEVFDAETIKRIVPMRRAGTPEEVAALVNFLASEQAGYISGQVIGINGAMG
ncbi:3-oxoacyl-ACP reductase FabG [Alkalilimnicola sp. S0819]|uniref:3-oxoacyl-ACP reductase FabG n=1 Tax=Alkalilimnicola sp. S0819 TaxID=2613922 RepID=UPI00126241B4|nr:3-oxoacyl-ACP reductase FabG [Alkalilimnicola sp. S0819]KAB7624184.1 3-oxoacyl-ACP reductase FabG [Alkalilimnicola sp. S0819]MPQ16439.1 3-oxoacyl-ACP reductase FabG [Alkalilimnicola sp. S0819]